jgi:hypothetical protein
MRGMEVRELVYDEPGEAREETLVLNFFMDCRDAMGANMINTTAEHLAPYVETLTQAKVMAVPGARPRIMPCGAWWERAWRKGIKNDSSTYLLLLCIFSSCAAAAATGTVKAGWNQDSVQPCRPATGACAHEHTIRAAGDSNAGRQGGGGGDRGSLPLRLR